MPRCFTPVAPVILASLLIVSGCSDRAEQAPPEPAPRPVMALELRETSPSRLDAVAGSVGSWKTEEMGFEVEGRVTYVLDVGSDVVGGLTDAEGNLLAEPTLLATLDTTRFELRKASIEAQIGQARRERDALVVEVEKVIPARRQAALALLELAKIEVARNEKLVPTGAGSQKTLDRARAQQKEKEAEVTGIDAQKDAKLSEVASVDAKILELQQSLKEAERDLADCRLYSPYRGQVARTHLIPGAYASRGEKTLTVQMMDPIKIDFEVSAATRRKLGSRARLPIRVRTETGEKRLPALIYVVDPVADQQTRTFTVTLLARNEKTRAALPASLAGQDPPRAKRLWKVITQEHFGEGLFVEASAIQRDAEGAYLWKVTKRDIQGMAGGGDAELKVEKVRIEVSGRRIPFLGIWTAVSIHFPAGAPFDPDRHFAVGVITYPEGQDAASWTGGSILFDKQRWLMQPGDVVSVDISDEDVPAGMYVPASCILERQGANFVFRVEPESGIVKKVAVRMGAVWQGLRRIEPAEGGGLEPGQRIVTDGALFLHDGDAVQVVEDAEVRR